MCVFEYSVLGIAEVFCLAYEVSVYQLLLVEIGDDSAGHLGDKHHDQQGKKCSQHAARPV